MKTLRTVKASCFGLAAVLALGLGAAASASTSELDSSNGTDSTAFDGDISSTDLLTNATVTFFTAPASSTTTIAGLSDGLADESNLPTLTVWSNVATSEGVPMVVTFALDTSSNAGGYDITGITGFAGYGSDFAYRDSNQQWSVEYSTVTAPATFHPLATVTYIPFDSGGDGSDASSKVVLTDTTGVMATNVGSLQFTFYPDVHGSGQTNIYREMDVFGTPAVLTPEPASLAMLGFGGLLLMKRARRIA